MKQHFPTQTNLQTLTFTPDLQNSTGKTLLGTNLHKHGSTITIGQYISTKLLPKEQTLHLTQKKRNLVVEQKIRNQVKKQLRSKNSLNEQKLLLLRQSKHSPVTPEHQVYWVHPPLKQVRFLESPNLQPQKSVRLLHLPCQRKKHWLHHLE